MPCDDTVCLVFTFSPGHKFLLVEVSLVGVSLPVVMINYSSLRCASNITNKWDRKFTSYLLFTKKSKKYTQDSKKLSSN